MKLKKIIGTCDFIDSVAIPSKKKMFSVAPFARYLKVLGDEDEVSRSSSWLEVPQR